MAYDGETLCNSVEWVAWDSGNPTQVCLCETCGHSGCSYSGFVHISHLRCQILWTRPYSRPGHSPPGMTAAEILGRFGAVHIPESLWHEWQGLFDTLPPIEAFPRTTRSDLLDAWLLGAPKRFRSPDGVLWEEIELAPVDRAGHVVSMVQDKLLACDHTDVNQAKQYLTDLIDWVRSGPAQPVDGEIVAPASRGAIVESLYLDSEQTDEWHAFARTEDGITLAFSNDSILVPSILAN